MYKLPTLVAILIVVAADLRRRLKVSERAGGDAALGKCDWRWPPTSLCPTASFRLSAVVPARTAHKRKARRKWEPSSRSAFSVAVIQPNFNERRLLKFRQVHTNLRRLLSRHIVRSSVGAVVYIQLPCGVYLLCSTSIWPCRSVAPRNR